MFSGLTNQISGWVANKTGQGEVDPNADPNAVPPQQYAQENGGEYAEQGVEGGEQAQQPGGIGGFAQGLMMKAMTVKDGVKEKAAAIAPPNLGAMGGQVMGMANNLIPGRKEEEVPDVQPQQEGFPVQGEGQYIEGGEVQYTE